MATSTLRAPKLRVLDTEHLFDILMAARTAEIVSLMFKDGRTYRGNLVFNQFKGTGRLINIDEELSLDFGVEELRDVKF